MSTPDKIIFRRDYDRFRKGQVVDRWGEGLAKGVVEALCRGDDPFAEAYPPDEGAQDGGATDGNADDADATDGDASESKEDGSE